MSALLSQPVGSLYRGIVLPFSIFVLLASLAMAGYISYWSQRDALRQLSQMAETNAKFIEELQLPFSEALSDKLSTVLGVRVEFYKGGPTTDLWLDDAAWSAGFTKAMRQALETGRAAYHLDGREVAIAPFPRREMKLVLVRESRSFMATGLGDAVLVPTVLLTFACGCLAYYLARRIVRPLTSLTGWLPHLEQDDRAVPEVPDEISRRNDEIGELARSLGETHRRLREEQRRRRQSERMATLGRIATSLAHEIRNPASSIGLHADLLARHPAPSSEESIRLIRNEVDRITDLVNQWLFVVRPAPPQSGSHDLVALVRRIAESLRAAADHAGARLCLVDPERAFPVNCDHARIEQVVRNLLVNAIQALPEGGVVRIGFEMDGDNVVIAVHDSGPGFSEDALQRFGEPFFSEREGGMGIGLTLAREVIEAHHGEIHTTNHARGGGLVRIQLPLENAREGKIG
jgi:signal transduction histidine kinase